MFDNIIYYEPTNHSSADFEWLGILTQYLVSWPQCVTPESSIIDEILGNLGGESTILKTITVYYRYTGRMTQFNTREVIFINGFSDIKRSE